ncbi:hypothetical protein GCM10009661_44450 [Catellatospora chokoriensis]|uniref:Peptidoglycan binding domain-containing protein n=2 Tax=Catellatospora chokoriensis TaxID=310353 RepID=A0A8J3K3C5_9ACTN|nr:hypothetical protein Cch02nite_55820 [Catellatospora chokoriensis]
MRQVLTAAVVAGAAVAGVAAPVQAAEPTCNSYGRALLEHQEDGIYVPLYNNNETCKLTPGDTNNGVLGLQKNLNRCARVFINNSGWTDLQFSTLSEDRDFGPNTKAALIKAQKAINRELGVGIATDGGYGPQTRKWLEYFDVDGGCGQLAGQP